MKKPYLRSAILTLGLVAGTILVEGQSGGGAAGGGAAAGGAAGGTAAGGTATAGSGTAAGGVVTSGTAVRGSSGNTTGGRATSAGAANTVGGASVLEANPNNIGQSGGIATQVAPGSQVGTQPAAQLNTLPVGAQRTLGTFAANGQLGSVTAVPGQPGTFRATVTQNGVPMELTIGANGQILSRTPVTGSGGTTPNNGTVAAQQGLNGATINGVPVNNANANGVGTTPFVSGSVLPPTAVVMGDLPNNIQESIRAQLGGVDPSRIMQTRSANGANYVVTYDQNGRPMTLVVGPDGRIISNGPAAPTASATASARTTTNATREVTMTLDELPNEIEEALKNTAPYAEVRTVTREQRVGGDVYVIAVRDGDRAGEITFDDDGKVIRDTRRDLSALTPRKNVVDIDKPQGMPYDTLPVAIKNAIRAYASTADIRSITLGADNDGRTIYDVIFYRDGRRDRMVIRKDGSLNRIENDVSPALELASTKAPVIALGDLPQEVQDTVRRQTDNVQIKDINTKEVANQTVYAVRWETNGAPVELLVNRDGTVIQTEGSTTSESANAPRPAILDREEQAVVKVVDDTPGTNRETLNNVGTAARTERGVSVSAEANTGSSSTSSATVQISDAPQPVQDTAKKLAGAGVIESVTPKLEAGGMVYEVRYQDVSSGTSRTVQIDRTGQALPDKQTATEP